MATNNLCSHQSGWKDLIIHKVLGRGFRGYCLGVGPTKICPNKTEAMIELTLERIKLLARTNAYNIQRNTTSPITFIKQIKHNAQNPLKY